MTREEILAVAESDKDGCNTINRLVHEKLGECWHDWAITFSTAVKVTYTCAHCDISQQLGMWYKPSDNPDYTHDIKATWAIKKWLDEQDTAYYWSHNTFEKTLALVTKGAYPLWIGPLDRCKAFVLMDTRIRATEGWLSKNPAALGLVKQGLEDAAQGKVSEVDLRDL